MALVGASQRGTRRLAVLGKILDGLQGYARILLKLIPTEGANKFQFAYRGVL